MKNSFFIKMAMFESFIFGLALVYFLTFKSIFVFWFSIFLLVSSVILGFISYRRIAFKNREVK